MTTLFLISVVIFFIWLQSKQRKLNWIDIITFLMMIGIITYMAPQPMTRDLQAELLAVTLFSFAIGVWQGGGITVCYGDEILYITNGKQFSISWVLLMIGNIIIINIFEDGFTFNGPWFLLCSVVIASGVKNSILCILYKLTVRN
ncbi:hypothetical protein CN572_12450 [Bacillus wiedmannii]|uniref:hypothetical protein n=1 Tax=Bacillus wiedmannii TaxID=1890302 RepID=UPI000BF0F69D|nr:hypothetical protein [Bacillus wiedmannii]PEI77726.1 hypothetical protein CN905_15090 [Bacillus wiedmannii]PEO73002.1 hypothetical protein CN572_12450 [Bacillus wiedmannii]PFZ67804.1 hypothetical protein COL76_00755 [Bacillus wiedmannii]PHE00758.1 hypothetical protein COF56_21505 [Bacillus wiedmannii]PHG61856.1 hypothetical protein COI55_23975 [Bacillus wiedmannii]